jgi:hypothetical protein
LVFAFEKAILSKVVWINEVAMNAMLYIELVKIIRGELSPIVRT